MSCQLSVIAVVLMMYFAGAIEGETGNPCFNRINWCSRWAVDGWCQRNPRLSRALLRHRQQPQLERRRSQSPPRLWRRRQIQLHQHHRSPSWKPLRRSRRQLQSNCTRHSQSRQNHPRLPSCSHNVEHMWWRKRETWPERCYSSLQRPVQTPAAVLVTKQLGVQDLLSSSRCAT
eukprot:s828_g21.t4